MKQIFNQCISKFRILKQKSTRKMRILTSFLLIFVILCKVSGQNQEYGRYNRNFQNRGQDQNACNCAAEISDLKQNQQQNSANTQYKINQVVDRFTSVLEKIDKRLEAMELNIRNVNRKFTSLEQRIAANEQKLENGKSADDGSSNIDSAFVRGTFTNATTEN